MNKKINQEILNLIYKGKRVYYQVIDSKIYITDSYRLWVLNQNDLKIDKKYLQETSLEQILNKYLTDSEYKVPTQDYMLLNRQNKYHRVFKSGEYLVKAEPTYFRLFEFDSVKVKNETSPILLYLGDEFVGLIMPIKEY